MSRPRHTPLAGLAVLALALGLAACADRTPAASADTATGAQTGAIDETRTEPSEAARAQQAGEASPGPDDSYGTPMGEPAPAEPQAAMLNQLAGLGGAMHAAVELCDPNISAAQLAQARERQQQEFVRLGGDAGVFEQEFTTAHGRVRQQYTSATPSQQTQMCAELQAMAGQAPPPQPN
ncbi:hypothetical protein [Luteimonas deserti]|uniref:DUF4168 domain-containing protein n=1 Tax=Luteimonas deserti TaxID=2752306 RepID=A0A7Z0TTJ1_9GAMM|nr:hypothetical protein [Luteimonas deserti]NYZ61851.1 hypothetical protein [Luteimonas deserti]